MNAEKQEKYKNYYDRIKDQFEKSEVQFDESEDFENPI